MRPTLKAPGTERLKVEYEEQLSNFAFKIYLRRHIKVKHIQLSPEDRLGGTPLAGAYSRPLFSSTRAVSDTEYTITPP